jgi:hypothetical protein
MCCQSRKGQHPHDPARVLVNEAVVDHPLTRVGRRREYLQGADASSTGTTPASKRYARTSLPRRVAQRSCADTVHRGGEGRCAELYFGGLGKHGRLVQNLADIEESQSLQAGEEAGLAAIPLCNHFITHPIVFNFVRLRHLWGCKRAVHAPAENYWNLQELRTRTWPQVYRAGKLASWSLTSAATRYSSAREGRSSPR